MQSKIQGKFPFTVEKLEYLLSGLRKKDCASKSTLENVLGDETSICVLLNRYWKTLNNKTDDYTDLENKLFAETSNSIKQFVGELYQTNFYGQNCLPFPEFDLQLKDLSNQQFNK